MELQQVSKPRLRQSPGASLLLSPQPGVQAGQHHHRREHLARRLYDSQPPICPATRGYTWYR